MNTKAKDLDFELNLLPILSVLSICICFLLTSAVWSRMGFIGINQAIGDLIPTSGRNPDSLFIKVKSNGQFQIQWKSGQDSSVLAEKMIQPLRAGKVDWSTIQKELSALVVRAKTKTVIVMPEVGVNYGKTIQLLDHLKGLALQIGLAPAIKGLR